MPKAPLPEPVQPAAKASIPAPPPQEPPSPERRSLTVPVWLGVVVGAVAVLAVVTTIVVLASGGNDDDTAGPEVTEAEAEPDPEPDPETEVTEPDGPPVAPSGASGDGVLRFGTLLPETGDLAFLGPPMFAGVDLAVEEINDAGGVLGEDIEVAHGDSGDTNTDQASQTVDRHLSSGVDAIIGAASSGVTFTVIDQITGAGVIQFSPTNTSVDLTTYPDSDLYFRVAPSDELQGQALADLIEEDGHQTVGLLGRDDPYGAPLVDFTAEALDNAGVTVSESVLYDPNAAGLGGVVSRAIAANPDAVVVAGFDETASILEALFASGYRQGSHDIYLVDGNIGDLLGDEFAGQPGTLQGIRGTLPGAEVPGEFGDRLRSVDPQLQDYLYGPESYDAVVITALAAEQAATDDPRYVADEINAVTRDGTRCTSFADCRDLILDGEDIDYDGIGGPYTFSDAGEPTVASYAILEYGPDNLIADSRTEFHFAEIG